MWECLQELARAPREVLNGEEVTAVLADYTSTKIDRAVWSWYASELQGATVAADSSVSLLLLYEQILYGLKAKEVKTKLTSTPQPQVIVTNNKGLYDNIQTERPSTRQGQKMQSLVYQILYDLVVDYGFSTFWVNAEHMLADGLTKLSSSGARVDLLRAVMDTCRIRITYCTTSGRKERHELQSLRPVAVGDKDLSSSIDVRGTLRVIYHFSLYLSTMPKRCTVADMCKAPPSSMLAEVMRRVCRPAQGNGQSLVLAPFAGV